MTYTNNDAVQALVDCAASRVPLGTTDAPGTFAHSGSAAGVPLYQNTNERLGIDFTVERLPFPHLQTMDPRVIRLPPGKNNEHHRHAHESLFAILEGEGEVLVGQHWSKVKKGDFAFVPRWIFHQSRNTSAAEDLVIFAITDFGFTSAVLGNYDQRTRLAKDGDDVTPTSDGAVSSHQ